MLPTSSYAFMYPDRVLCAKFCSKHSFSPYNIPMSVYYYYRTVQMEKLRHGKVKYFEVIELVIELKFELKILVPGVVCLISLVYSSCFCDGVGFWFVFYFCLFITLCCSLELCIQLGIMFPFLLYLLLLFFPQLFVKSPQTTTLPSCISFL